MTLNSKELYIEVNDKFSEIVLAEILESLDETRRKIHITEFSVGEFS